MTYPTRRLALKAIAASAAVASPSSHDKASLISSDSKPTDESFRFNWA
jgi:hypothetical protein